MRDLGDSKTCALFKSATLNNYHSGNTNHVPRSQKVDQDFFFETVIIIIVDTAYLSFYLLLIISFKSL